MTLEWVDPRPTKPNAIAANQSRWCLRFFVEFQTGTLDSALQSHPVLQILKKIHYNVDMSSFETWYELDHDSTKSMEVFAANARKPDSYCRSVGTTWPEVESLVTQYCTRVNHSDSSFCLLINKSPSARLIHHLYHRKCHHTLAFKACQLCFLAGYQNFSYPPIPLLWFPFEQIPLFGLLPVLLTAWGVRLTGEP